MRAILEVQSSECFLMHKALRASHSVLHKEHMQRQDLLYLLTKQPALVDAVPRDQKAPDSFSNFY